MKKKPKQIVQEFTIRPEQGFAMMAASMVPPKGYAFESMERKGSKAKITWIKI